jgi:hypothetical protein
LPQSTVRTYDLVMGSPIVDDTPRIIQIDETNASSGSRTGNGH